MKNNVLPKVSMSTAKLPRQKFNLSHDVNTSLDFGTLQPLMCRDVVGGSKVTLSVESLVRLAPMVSPTFGRMSLQMWHNFVAYADLLPRFYPSFMGQQPYSFGVNSYVPSKLPSVDIRLLSCLCLAGAKCTAYGASVGSVEGHPIYECAAWNEGDTVTRLNNLGVFSQNAPDYWVDDSTTVNPLWLDAGKIINREFTDPTGFCIPLSNFYKFNSSRNDNLKSLSGQRNDAVAIDTADVVIDYPNSGDYGLGTVFAFRLSSFGKRLRKILLGCGYQLNFTIKNEVSLMPLFAWYKSYFDVFGLTLYQGWETTNCSAVLNLIEQENLVDFKDVFCPHGLVDYGQYEVYQRSFMEFIYDLGNCWYTDSQDFVSAHITTQAVSPSVGMANGFVDVSVKAVDAGVDIAQNPIVMDDESVVGRTNGNNNNNIRATTLEDGSHAAIGSILHGALDEEYLKRLYVWTNRNTVAGREIEKLLRAQGLGAFVDATKPHFIGHSSLKIRVSDVTATSETATQPLGDYAGKGVAMNDGDNPAKNFVFENDEDGFVVSMMCLVPDSGFTQGIDPHLLALDKFSRHNPEFDGLGFEATPKSCIFGAIDVSLNSSGEDTSEQNFGFVPRYTGLKIAQNVMNGDFSLRSTRAGYLPYTLDRFAAVNDLVKLSDISSAVKSYYRPFSLADVPNATPLYRQICRFPWLTNFNRIFVNTGVDMNDYRFWFIYNALAVKGVMMVREDDNFLCTNVVDLVTYEPMLGLADSFETVEDGKRANVEMSKS